MNKKVNFLTKNKIKQKFHNANCIKIKTIDLKYDYFVFKWMQKEMIVFL